jgi:hypothetical protein
VGHDALLIETSDIITLLGDSYGSVPNVASLVIFNFSSFIFFYLVFHTICRNPIIHILNLTHHYLFVVFFLFDVTFHSPDRNNAFSSFKHEQGKFWQFQN